MNALGTAAVIRAYYEAWTGRDFDQAASLLADELQVEVPVNEYPTKSSFAAALKAFGSLSGGAELLAAMSEGQEGMLLYDMDVQGVGPLRVAEHFTVGDGRITRIRQVHDTAAVRAAGLAGGYTQRVAIRAPREDVFDAIASPGGPAQWWTTDVTGSAAVGGQLRFGFPGLDERMVMRVTASERPRAVGWSCEEHTRGGEWAGSQLTFELSDRGPRACQLDFRHAGLPAELVASGWKYFLASLAAYAETGTGTPFGE